VVVARRLRVVVRAARGALPVVVAASVSPTPACSDASPHGGGNAEGGGAGSGAAGTGGIDAGTSLTGPASPDAAGQGGGGSPFGNPPDAAIAADAGSGITISPPPVDSSCEMVVEIPPEGVPADPGQICAVTMTPVDSNRAATVQLQVGSDLTQVTGTITIASSLRSVLVGTPSVEVIDATDPGLLGLVVDQLVPSGNAFQLVGHWPAPFSVTLDGLTRITVRVTFEAACPDAPQVVHAVTDVHLCMDSSGGSTWVSSGAVCSVCRVIAEMAPSPIVPDPGVDQLPLARVLRLRIVELARVSGTVVLLAEHDAGPGVEYLWQASAGEIRQLAPDVIALSAEPGVRAPFVQVAAQAEDGAAVASWSFNDEVA
jgi:hypothetical protein